MEYVSLLQANALTCLSIASNNRSIYGPHKVFTCFLSISPVSSTSRAWHASFNLCIAPLIAFTDSMDLDFFCVCRRRGRSNSDEFRSMSFELDWIFNRPDVAFAKTLSRPERIRQFETSCDNNYTITWPIVCGNLRGTVFWGNSKKRNLKWLFF